MTALGCHLIFCLQVRKVHLNAHVIQFSQLCSLLGVTGQAASVLEAVKGCGVLVQGCWVVRSDLVYSRPEDSHKKNARDYIVSCSISTVVISTLRTICTYH